MPSALLFIGGALALVLARLFYYHVIKAIFSPLRDLPGPVSKGIFKTHLKHAMDPRISAIAQEEWYSRFGPNYRVKGFNWFDNRLLTMDPLAVNYILNHPLEYEKPQVTQHLISSLIGPGLLSSEGPRNRRQRKVVNPAFSAASLRSLTPIFFQKAEELREKWRSLMTDSAPGATLDVARWISRATFDVIGLTGFDYEFNAIQEESEMIYLAYNVMFGSTVNKGEDFMAQIHMMLPSLRKIMPNEGHKLIARTQKTIKEFGLQLINERREQHHVGKLNRFDILSLLVRANLAADVSPDMAITDDDICNHINTFLFAGSDTTSLGLAWGLLLLAQHPDMQEKLRKELVTLADDQPSHDGSIDSTADLYQRIDKLPYLDNVCREFLRLIPPVHSTIRVALKDDIIPVSKPMKYESGKWKGKERHVDGIRIAKGEFIHVPIEGFNLAKHIWGEDAQEFKPERWDNIPQAARSSPGLFSHMMTFGSGPRSCIGVRFSMMETKTMMFALLPAFNFAPIAAEIQKVNVILTRPYIKGEFRKGSQLPLIVTPVDRK